MCQKPCGIPTEGWRSEFPAPSGWAFKKICLLSPQFTLLYLIQISSAQGPPGVPPFQSSHTSLGGLPPNKQHFYHMAWLFFAVPGGIENFASPLKSHQFYHVSLCLEKPTLFFLLLVIVSLELSHGNRISNIPMSPTWPPPENICYGFSEAVL